VKIAKFAIIVFFILFCTKTLILPVFVTFTAVITLFSAVFTCFFHAILGRQKNAKSTKKRQAHRKAPRQQKSAKTTGRQQDAKTTGRQQDANDRLLTTRKQNREDYAKWLEFGYGTSKGDRMEKS